MFDLLIKGGEVVDPGAGYQGVMDIAIKKDRIAAVDVNIPEESAFQVIDAKGQFVTPGLIDMHAHLYEGVTYWGVNADAIGSQSGVTTWADAGSTGAVTLQGFRDYIIDRSKVKIYAFINIAYIGLVAQDYELANNEYCNVDFLKLVVNQNRDIVVGIKLRAGRSGGGVDLEPYYRARRAADELELPIMVHLSTAPPDLETVLGFLQPGDILTHCYTGQSMKLVDDQGKILDIAKKAIDDGLILDLGHGAGSLSFKTAEALVSQGIWPDVVSTDLHQMSIVGPNLVDPLKGSAFGDLSETSDARSVISYVTNNGEPIFNLLTCMDKMLYLGMSFPDVVRATTTRPAEILGVQGEVGTLTPGAKADVASLIVEDREVELVDIHGEKRKGQQKVKHIMTILDGRPFERVEIPKAPVWIQPVNED
jgi:dihydroorotase